MSILRLGHKHISGGTLNEYLDGRLSLRATGRVEQVIADCSVCREELEGLRLTATLLSQLPVLTPRRSFVLAQAPLEIRPQPSRMGPWLRAPQWAYAGAASMAILALALLVTLDATGLVAPGLEFSESLGVSQAARAPATAQIEITIESETVASQDSSRKASPAIQATPDQPEASVQEQAGSAAPEPDQPAVMALQAESSAAPVPDEPAVMASQAEAVSPTEAEILSAPAPLGIDARDAEGSSTPVVDTSAPVVEPSAEEAPVASKEAVEEPVDERLPSEPEPTDGDAIALLTPVSDASTAPVINPLPPPQTPEYWRILEGIAAALALVLAAIFVWKRWASRRS
jgi:hypothetical protein